MDDSLTCGTRVRNRPDTFLFIELAVRYLRRRENVWKCTKYGSSYLFDTISEVRVRAVYTSLAVDALKRQKTHLISQGRERFGRGVGAENALQAEDMVENLTVPCL